MAKKSTESLSIATVSIPVRADAPTDLTKRQVEVWNGVIATKPPDWFEEDTYPLLKAYCVAVDLHEKVVAKLNDAEIDADGVHGLMKMQDTQIRIMTSVAVKMRLTQQSRYTPGAAATANKKAASGAKPWEK